MKSKKRIEKEWLDFERRVMPKNAPAVQRQEMRRAFYAGVSTALIMAFALGDDDASEDEGAAVLESMHQECIEFAAQVGTKY
jgi:hypothetical protein